MQADPNLAEGLLFASPYLRALYAPVLLANFAALLYYCRASRRELKAAAAKNAGGLLLPSVLIGLLALFLRAGMSGRYGLDSLLWDHIANALSLAENLRFRHLLHPGGHSLLIAPVYLLRRSPEAVSALTMALDAASSVLLVYCGALFFRSRTAGLFSGFIFAVLPWQIFISGMGLDVSSSGFFTLLGVLLIMLAAEAGSPGASMAALCAVLWAAQIRTENLALLLAIFPAGLRRAAFRDLSAAQYALLSLFALPSLSWLLAVPAMYGPAPQEGTAGFITLSALLNSLTEAIPAHFRSADSAYPAWFLPAAGAGAAYLLIARSWKRLLLLLAAGALWIVIYAGFWCGSGQFYRYSTLIHPLLAALAGRGVSALAGLAAARLRRAAAFAWYAAAAALLFSAIPAGRLFRPAPHVFWPSVRELAAIPGAVGRDACVLVQELPRARHEGLRLLIGNGPRLLPWPGKIPPEDGSCSAVYYADVREYAHPYPEFFAEYDSRQAELFSGYSLSTVLVREPLRLYRVSRRSSAR